MATKNNGKTPAAAPHTAADLDDEELDVADFSSLPLPAEFGTEKLENVSTGYAPYIRPKKGLVVDLIVRALDIADPDFIRITCEYLGSEPLECRQGAKGSDDEEDESTPVYVRKGELFNFSWYATLPLELGIAHATPLRVIALKRGTVGKMENGEPKKLWSFALQTSAKGKQQIASEKARAAAWGPRNTKVNPTYLLAFVGEGLSLPKPPEGLVIGRLPPKPQRQAASAEA